MKYKKFLSLDYETEHLNLKENKPWQLGYTLFDHKGVLEQKEYWIWWPDLKLSKGAAFATKFDYATYEYKANPANGQSSAILPEELVTESPFIKYVHDPEVGIVWQNGLGFDCYIQAATKKYFGIKEDWTYLKRSFDTSLICKGLKMDLKPDSDNILAWQYKVQSERNKIKTNLKSLVLEYGIPYHEERHHTESLYDTEMCMDVFNKVKFNLSL